MSNVLKTNSDMSISELAIPKQDIIFWIKNKQIIKLDENGDIYVKGKLIQNDIEVVEGFKEFLQNNNSDNLDFKNIYNIKGELYLRDISNAKKMAMNDGYELFRFNDIIYFIDEDKNIHKTKIKVNNEN
jgi:hypothetical protein